MTAESVLREFVKDINYVGGVTVGDDGLYRLVIDEDWIDLAETYMKACHVLGIEPVVEGEG